MKRSTTSRILILSGVILTCIISVFGVSKDKETGKRAKARYYYLKGAEKEAQGKEDEAYEYFKKAYRTDPDYADASYAYGLNRSALRQDTFKSIAELRKDLMLMLPYIELYPTDSEAAERYAYAASFADTLPEGIRVYKRLLKERPGLSRLYIPLSYYYMNLGHTDSAVYAVREFERLEGATTETTIRKVTAWLTLNDTLAALQEARDYAAAFPGKPEPIIDKAMIFGALGQPDSAINFLEDALKQFPNRSEMKFDIGLLYAEKGDSVKFHNLVDEAFRGEDMEYEDRMGMLDVYTKSLPFGASDYAESDRLYEYAETLYGDDADFFDQYTNYEIVKGNFKGAFEKSKKALSLNPTEPSFLGRVISFSIVADSPKEGVKAFEEFPLEEAKRDYSMMLTYVTALQGAKENEKAVAWLDTILESETPGLSLDTQIKPEMTDSLEARYSPLGIYRSAATYEVAGDFFAKVKEPEKAIKAYENAILLSDSTNISALNNYAYYLVERLKVAPGSDEFEKAKRMSRLSLEGSADPQGTYLDTYAWILFKEGDYKNALDYQEMAIDAEGDNAAGEIFEHYGDILIMNGREEEALEQWTKALKLEPDNELLKKKIEQKAYIDPAEKEKEK